MTSTPLYIYPITAFVFSAVALAFGMPLLLRICRQFRLYDKPNERKVHMEDIPRLGGTLFAPAMVIGIGAAMLLMMLRHTSSTPIQTSSLVLVCGMFLIYLIGVMDDLIGMRASIKFLVQFVSALFMPLCGLYLNNLYGFCGIWSIPVWVSYPLTVFIILIIVNSWNLIDGIDGLSSSLGMLSLGILTFLFLRLGVVSYTVLSGSLIGALFVFFLYNMLGKVERGTKIFMGDTGSLILGYTIAYLTIKYAMDKPEVLPARPVAILMSYTLVIVPVFDLCRVALCRMWRGKGIFEADKTHIHHLFLINGFTMHQTLCYIVGLQIVFIALNSVMFVLGTGLTWIFITNLLIYVSLIFWLNKATR